MKLTTPTLLLLCVSALSITSTAGSYNHGHPLLMSAKTHSQGQPEAHKILKRQGDNSDEDDVCGEVFLDAICTNGLLQEQANVAQRCLTLSDTNTAPAIQNSCTRNSMDIYCGIMDIDSLQTNVERMCNGSTCSSECRDLLISARSELGCCVNILNDSTIYDFIAPFAYSLWSGCDVDPVTRECSPSSIMLRPANLDPCDVDSYFQHVFASSCRQQYREDILDRLSATGRCQDFDVFFFDLCDANRHGTYCTFNSSWVQANFTAASENCRDTSKCDPLCVETLNNIAETAGCCFNEHFNKTYMPYDWLSDEFWSRCGVKSPGFCQPFFNNDSPDAAAVMKASRFAVTLAVTMAAMMLWTVI